MIYRFATESSLSISCFYLTKTFCFMFLMCIMYCMHFRNSLCDNNELSVYVLFGYWAHMVYGEARAGRETEQFKSCRRKTLHGLWVSQLRRSTLRPLEGSKDVAASRVNLFQSFLAVVSRVADRHGDMDVRGHWDRNAHRLHVITDWGTWRGGA